MADINPELLPIQLDPAVTTFEANGHTYHVERQARMTIARDRWLEKFGLYALLGRDGMSFLKEVRRAYDALNAGKALDSGVIMDNLMRASADLSAKEAPLYYVCTLFINRTDEDRRGYDLELGKQKILDWEAAGIDRNFFLSLGLNFLSITGAQLSSLMQTYSGIRTPELTMQDPSVSESE
ncbi:hypothetical protein [Spirosoma utsteinense]|uniref:hypothetical protein n=1 Tax=Spirosoma utsteinense TaxID=2585773 RepID=UPI001647157A|nr:hypothetical protein [Spirosoma utsteinense]MBC3785712.1 hypothetical protein [Spirosoma utsteinense]